jgi:hypothetical protein
MNNSQLQNAINPNPTSDQNNAFQRFDIEKSRPKIPPTSIIAPAAMGNDDGPVGG